MEEETTAQLAGDEFRPVLAFERRGEPETLYFCSGGLLHELVDEAVDLAFKWSS
jgi:hypothetical protein